MELRVNLALATSLHLIRELQAQVKRLETAIAEQLAVIPGANCLLSIKGIGLVYAAGILAEIGPIRRFAGDPALAKFAGLVWSKSQSGDFEAEDRRLLKSGNRYLRYYLIEAANSLRVHDAEFKRFYQAKYAEATKHAHKRALALTARKLVRLVDALLRSNRLYRPRTRVEA